MHSCALEGIAAHMYWWGGVGGGVEWGGVGWWGDSDDDGRYIVYNIQVIM
jgi:hypothetical protein